LYLFPGSFPKESRYVAVRRLQFRVSQNVEILSENCIAPEASDGKTEGGTPVGLVGQESRGSKHSSHLGYGSPQGGSLMPFQVWIVEEGDDHTASLSPAGFSSPDAELAKAWADEFNAGELVNPVDAWAVVKCDRDAPALHQKSPLAT
jgi:hypothetical protein